MKGPHRIYRFENCAVDADQYQVYRAGRPISLEPRAFQVLLVLIGQRGRLVTKEELMQEVWLETFVTDNALTRVIAQLRKALGDNAKQARYIETVPTQGYRFIAEVKEEEGPLEELSAPTAEVRKNRRVAALLIVLPAALLMIGGLLWRGSGRRVVTRLPGSLRTLQLTTSTGLDHSPSFSPDGSNIVYASDRSGGFEIYVRGVAPGSREVQLTKDGGQNIQPAFSPDGKEIAYYSARQGSIHVVPSLGGFARMVSEFGCEPAWSPDGEWIAFRSGGFLSLSAPERRSPGSSFSLGEAIAGAMGRERPPKAESSGSAGSATEGSVNKTGPESVPMSAGRTVGAPLGKAVAVSRVGAGSEDLPLNTGRKGATRVPRPSW